MSKSTGGPAFPLSTDPRSLPSGMTLREYFAATVDISGLSLSDEAVEKLMGEEIPDHNDIEAFLDFNFRMLAKIRFMAADAMITARLK